MSVATSSLALLTRKTTTTVAQMALVLLFEPQLFYALNPAEQASWLPLWHLD